MKQNTARDFLLLAAVAYRSKRYPEAGQMFAAAMSAADAPEVLNFLDSEQEFQAEASAGWIFTDASGAPPMNIAEITTSISAAIEEMDEEDTEEEEDLETGDLTDEEDDSDIDDDATSDDLDPDVPGTIIPSSLSSSSSEGGAEKVQLVLGEGAPSSVRINQ